jgi:hypothetical protein
VKLIDDDMRNFSWFYVLLFAVLAALVIWSIVGAIVWSPS